MWTLLPNWKTGVQIFLSKTRIKHTRSARLYIHTHIERINWIRPSHHGNWWWICQFLPGEQPEQWRFSDDRCLWVFERRIPQEASIWRISSGQLFPIRREMRLWQRRRVRGFGTNAKVKEIRFLQMRGCLASEKCGRRKREMRVKLRGKRGKVPCCYRATSLLKGSKVGWIEKKGRSEWRAIMNLEWRIKRCVPAGQSQYSWKLDLV